jgi:hypothetical protein
VFQLLVPTRRRAVSAPAICDRARIERLFVPAALSGTMQAPLPTVTGPRLLRTPARRQRSRIHGNTRDPPRTLAAKAPAINATRPAGPGLDLQPGTADLAHP